MVNSSETTKCLCQLIQTLKYTDKDKQTCICIDTHAPHSVRKIRQALEKLEKLIGGMGWGYQIDRSALRRRRGRL